MKKLFSLLMALCLLCAALPVVAENADTDRAAAIRAKFLEKADEVVVTDQGQLRAMHRARPFGAVDIRTGITVDLPEAFITPVRHALATLAAELDGMGESP